MRFIKYLSFFYVNSSLEKFPATLLVNIGSLISNPSFIRTAIPLALEHRVKKDSFTSKFPKAFLASFTQAGIHCNHYVGEALPEERNELHLGFKGS